MRDMTLVDWYHKKLMYYLSGKVKGFCSFPVLYLYIILKEAVLEQNFDILSFK